MMSDYPKRGDIYWVRLDPTEGSEIKKTRPCVVISNNSQNKKNLRLIVVPITSKIKTVYPFEALLVIKGRQCKALIDQIRSIDHRRLGSRVVALEMEDILQIESALKVALDLK